MDSFFFEILMSSSSCGWDNKGRNDSVKLELMENSWVYFLKSANHIGTKDLLVKFGNKKEGNYESSDKKCLDSGHIK